MPITTGVCIIEPLDGREIETYNQGLSGYTEMRVLRDVIWLQFEKGLASEDQMLDKRFCHANYRSPSQE